MLGHVLGGMFWGMFLFVVWIRQQEPEAPAVKEVIDGSAWSF